MKKILTFIMIVAVAIAMCACKKTDSNVKVTIPAAVNKANAKKITLNEKTTVSEGKTISEMEFTDGGRYVITYVVTKADDAVEYKTGAYTVVNGVYLLEGFGTITIAGDNITIEITGGETVETTGTIETPDPQMEEIAQTWTVNEIDVSISTSKGNIGFTKDGCNLEKIATELVDQAERLGYNVNIDLGNFSGLSIKYVSFSSSGTFMVEFDNNDVYIGEMSNFKEESEGYYFHYDLKEVGNEIVNSSADCKFMPQTETTAWLVVNVNMNGNDKGRVIFIMSNNS